MNQRVRKIVSTKLSANASGNASMINAIIGKWIYSSGSVSALENFEATMMQSIRIRGVWNKLGF